MFFSKKKVIGLDIGTSSIKLAELNSAGNKHSLVSFAMTPTPAHSMSGGDILEPPSIAEAIQQLVAEIKTKRKIVATALWGNSVVVKRISIPQMDKSLIGEQIRWEAEQYVPYDLNDVNLDYRVLDSTDEALDVLLIAAVQDSMYKCVEIIQMAGFTCEVLDVEGFALANCFEVNYGQLKGQNIVLLNIGGSLTNFVVIENGNVVFCRDIPIGGSTYTSELQKALGLSFEEAEAMKISASRGQAAPQEAANIISQTHEQLVEEINSSVEFFLNTSQAGEISMAFVTGGCLKTSGLWEKLSSTFNCQRLDPFRNVKVKLKNCPESYIKEIRDYASVAIGLGLRGAKDT